MTHSFEYLTHLTDARSRRVSSWDRRGANRDYLTLEPGSNTVLADIEGPGQINHLYMIVIDPTMLALRKFILRLFWDDEPSPSVEVPLGDFFCVSHATPRPVSSQLVTVNPGNRGKWCPVSYGLNSYFAMPFSKRALATVEYRTYADRESYPLMLWYHIDYESRGAEIESPARFHAQWRRERLTDPVEEAVKNIHLWDGVNLDARENYRILEAEGRGHLVGVHLQIDNLAGGWYGEGDDMVFVDEEAWPPSIHGTGTEEIFGGGACPCSEYTGPYSGVHLIENEDFSGKHGMYRWYIADPIRFQRSLRFSIEHGHANNFANDYTSVAYWYQTEPHGSFPALPDTEGLLPRFPRELFEAEGRIAEILKYQPRLERKYGESGAFGLVWKLVNDGAAALLEGRYRDALGTYAANLGLLGDLGE